MGEARGQRALTGTPSHPPSSLHSQARAWLLCSVQKFHQRLALSLTSVRKAGVLLPGGPSAGAGGVTVQGGVAVQGGTWVMVQGQGVTVQKGRGVTVQGQGGDHEGL